MCRDWHVTKTVNSASPRNPPSSLPPPITPAPLCVDHCKYCTGSDALFQYECCTSCQHPPWTRESEREWEEAHPTRGEGILGGIEVGGGSKKKKSLFLISIYFYLFIYWLTPPPVTASNRRDERRCTVQTSDAFCQSSSWRNKQKQNLITAKCYFFI